ncbi:hypothetical protein SLE2022_045490 [Rubroshorea leprosula]
MEKKLVLPILGMVISECALVGLMIVGKAAMSRGMSNFIFVFYCNALASLILLPSAFLFHRSERPPLTFSILCWFFLLGLLRGVKFYFHHLAQFLNINYDLLCPGIGICWDLL